MIKHQIKIFCDFDGTISQTDIGNMFYRTFGNPSKCEEIVELWQRREINSSECLSSECQTITELTEIKIDTFINEQKIDPFFPSFVQFCKDLNIEIFIVSDGIDVYIKKLLQQNSIDIPFFSNAIVINSDGSAEMVYPHSDNSCNLCANCKRNHVINNSSDDEICIYIGDGHSDFCPVEYCDFIFAKNHLMINCQKNKLPFFQFNDFNDVLNIMQKLVSKKRLKKRNQQLLKRKELYMSEA